jgi:hypothetical protein
MNFYAYEDKFLVSKLSFVCFALYRKKRVPMETRIIKGKFGYAYGKVKKKLVEGQDLETDCEDGKQQQSKALCVASTSTSNYNPQQNVKSARQVQVRAVQDKENSAPRYPCRNVPRII